MLRELGPGQQELPVRFADALRAADNQITVRDTARGVAANGRYGLSETGFSFIGGVLAHLPALVALTAPTVNSYRRLQPRFW